MKKFVVLTVVMLVCLLSAGFMYAEAASTFPPAKAISGPEKANIDWKQFEGETIAVMLANIAWQESIMEYIPEFEELTGMKVNLILISEEEFMTKLPADLTAGSLAYDVFASQYYDSPKYAMEKWTADLEPFINDPALTDPEWYAWDDFYQSAQDVATIGNTYFDRIAVELSTQVLIYREDVYKELGLSVPKTFEELLSNAKTISENTKLAGITLRGGHALWHPMYGIIRSYGGGYFDEDYKPIVNQEQAAAGAKMYADLCQYAPPGVVTYDWNMINTAIVTGVAAQFLDNSAIWGRVSNPEISTVIGKAKMAPFPAGPDGLSIGHAHFWSISMAETSQKKKQGWLFMEWITSKEIMYRSSLKGILPPRKSAWAEPAFLETLDPDVAEAVQKGAETAVLSPVHPRFFEFMDILRADMQEVILGEKDLMDALNYTQGEWEKMLAE